MTEAEAGVLVDQLNEMFEARPAGEGPGCPEFKGIYAEMYDGGWSVLTDSVKFHGGKSFAQVRLVSTDSEEYKAI